MYKVNNSFLVKTPSGFKPFSGIQKIYKPYYHWIIFDDKSEIKCSGDHAFGKERIKASSLKINDFLQGKKVVYNEIVEEEIYLYDLLDVGEDNLYYSNNIISHNCEFLGSVDTLISPSKLRTLVYEEAIQSNAGLDIFQKYIPEHDYVITVDVSRGVGKDYSAFIVVDITQYPHKVVAKYRNNTIKALLFPNIIYDVAKNYGNAFVLCEVNDVGDQVASILHYDLEYTNVLMCAMRGRAGQILGQGFSGKKSQLGLKMSRGVKQVGCLNLKALVEDDKIIFNDYDIISELTTFIQRNNAFGAEDGCNDDLAMCLVIYAWLVLQPYFKELTDQDIRKRLYEEKKNEIEQDMSPFGFIIDGIDEETTFVDKSGDRWYLDEYGDKSNEWEYMWKY